MRAMVELWVQRYGLVDLLTEVGYGVDAAVKALKDHKLEDPQAPDVVVALFQLRNRLRAVEYGRKGAPVTVGLELEQAWVVKPCAS